MMFFFNRRHDRENQSVVPQQNYFVIPAPASVMLGQAPAGIHFEVYSTNAPMDTCSPIKSFEDKFRSRYDIMGAD
jgi:hypothetical protein